MTPPPNLKQLNLKCLLTLTVLLCHVGVSQCSLDQSPANDFRKVAKVRVFEDEQYEIKSCLSPDLEQHEKYTCRFYALMIDAGSTGTRIHIFEFSHDAKHPAVAFKLEGESFKEVKPGLSSFQYRPKEALLGIEQLIDKAKAVVPRNLWTDTPLALRATAGLRLLPAGDAEAILDEIEDYFSKSQFLISDDSVTLMSGTDEGIFAWFTLNFLLDRIDAVLQKPEQLLQTVNDNLTATALDLGGGSTQITLRPLRKDTVKMAPDSYIKHITIFGQDVTLYTHSYLGNGLYAARLGALQLSTGPGVRNRLQSSCFPADFGLKWDYNATEFSVRGRPGYSYESCLSEVRAFVQASGVSAPEELPNRHIYAFSYFFDRALQSGLVHSTDGGLVRVRDFENAAKTACARTKLQFGREHWHPWQCLDLNYIYSLLTDGYSLPNNKGIYLAKKVRGMETSWALGASYHLLNTYHERMVQSGLSVYSRYAQDACFYMCSRLYYGVTTILSYFQLLA